jgi:hypothetical protein
MTPGLRIVLLGARPFNPLDWFRSGEQGFWYDTQDLSSMYQDSAGTTAATAPGRGAADCQVGLRMDKSGRGNHASQSTAGSCPTLSARYNILVGTAALATQSVTTLAASYTLAFTGTGTVELSGTSTAGPLVGTGASDRVSLTFTPTAGALTLTVTGSVTLADLRLTADALTAIPAYQDVVDAANYSTSCFPWFLKTDGTDDGMVTNTIDFTGTDKMTVLAGVTKLSDAAEAIIFELSSNATLNAGGINLWGPGGLSVAHDSAFVVVAGGSIPQAHGPAAATSPAPISRVVAVTSSIATDTSVTRVNGVQAASATGDMGSGNFGNYPAYLFRRGGVASPFLGRDYGQIVRGAASTASSIVAAEHWLAKRMGLSF